ncbi:MAG: O-antigen ligase family protein [Rhodothermales bacterium]
MHSGISPHLPQSDRFRQWGNFALLLCFTFGLFVLAMATWLYSSYLAVLPLAILLGITAGILLKDPLRALSLTLLGFFLILRKDPTLAILEMVFHAYLIGYLIYWFVSRSFFYKQTVLKDAADWLFFLYLVYTTCTLYLTIVFGGKIAIAISEWVPMTVFAIYFPIKEACYRHENGVRIILGSVCALALILVALNFYEYYTDLTSAVELWRIAEERVRSNELLMMTMVIGLGVHVVYAPSNKYRLFALALLIPFAAGVLITQSRSLWVATALGGGITFLVSEGKQRRRLLLLGTGGLLAILFIGFIFLNEYFLLVFTSFLDRFSSLQTATSKDISLINRFSEWSAAWEAIKLSPVLGHGYGVQFRFFDLTREVTMVKSHIHSVYIGVFYRHGLIGLGLIGTFYLMSIKKAFFLVKFQGTSFQDKLLAIGALSCLVSISLAATTESLLLVDPGTITIALVTGLVAGRWHRYMALQNDGLQNDGIQNDDVKNDGMQNTHLKGGSSTPPSS